MNETPEEKQEREEQLLGDAIALNMTMEEMQELIEDK